MWLDSRANLGLGVIGTIHSIYSATLIFTRLFTLIHFAGEVYFIGQKIAQCILFMPKDFYNSEVSVYVYILII